MNTPTGGARRSADQGVRPALCIGSLALKLGQGEVLPENPSCADAQGYVWPGTDGGPMHDRSLARALERACARAGLVENPQRGKDERPIPLVTPHGLRHSCASIMLAAGVPLIVVSRQLGHANPNITAMIYAHLLGDSQLDDAAAVFEAKQEAAPL